MSDPLRTDPASDPLSEAGRDAKIEQLLLAGLDHYLDGQFDQAINVWTRALFLDRGHARARAYIERARSALAEQWEVAARIVIPDSIADDCRAWMRVTGTTTLRDGFHLPYLTPHATVSRIGRRTFRVRGVGCRAMPCSSSASWG